jgi:antitoxin (DNA-binding transcriptional repressor) of toxin-antitoxin stability system
MRNRRNHGRVTATEAAKTFGRLVERVREERTTYVIERGGKPVAQVIPIGQQPFTFGALRALVAQLPRADAEYLESLEEITALRNRPKARANPWAR